MDRYAKDFLYRRELAVGFSIWIAIALFCFFVVVANGSDPIFLFFGSSEPLPSLLGIVERFVSYTYWIGLLIMVGSYIYDSKTDYRDKKIDPTKFSKEYILRTTRIARYFYISISTLTISDAALIFFVVFLIPSDKTIGGVFNIVLGRFLSNFN